MPKAKDTGYDAVERLQAPCLATTIARRTIQLPQRPQTDQGAQQAAPHRNALDQRRGGREAGVDVHMGGQAVVDKRVLILKLRVHTRDLRTVIILAGLRVGRARDLNRGLLVRHADVQLRIVGEVADFVWGELEKYVVEGSHHQAAVGSGDEQATVRRLIRRLRQRTEDQTLALTQFADAASRHRDLKVLRGQRNQRCVDRTNRVVLRPRHARLRLLHRQKRGEQQKHKRDETRNGRNKTSRSSFHSGHLTSSPRQQTVR